MDSWRRKSFHSQNQEGMRIRSQNRKPPLDNWHPFVPSWEKKFCWEVGAVPWRKLLETKRFIDTSYDIKNWDDSAAGEAFQNAKARYWARLNGLPCDLPWPNPDAYIDDVDWDIEVNPELISDLDRDIVVSDDPKGEGVLIFGEHYAKSRGLTENGWGNEEDFKVVTDSDLDKIQEESRHIHADVTAVRIDYGRAWDAEDQWKNRIEKNGEGGGNRWNCDSGWNKWEGKVNKFGKNWEDNSYNSNNREGNSAYMSKYKITRFHGNGSQVNESGHRFDSYKEGGYNSNYRESNGRNMSRYKTTRFNGDGQVNNLWEKKNQNGRRGEFY